MRDRTRWSALLDRGTGATVTRGWCVLSALVVLACGRGGDGAADSAADTTARASSGATADSGARASGASAGDEREAMLDALREAEFPLALAGASTIRLRGGTAGDGASGHRVALDDVIALGDLNRDDRLDAAIPLLVDSAGQATDVHLALALREGEAARPVAITHVGRAVVIDSLRIAGDSVIAFMREGVPGGNDSATGGRMRTRTWTWREGRLTAMQ